MAGQILRFPETAERGRSPVLCDQCARPVDGKSILAGDVRPLGLDSYLVEPDRLDRNVPCGCYADAVWLKAWRTDA
jgi:hypothetical protein